MGLSVKSLFLVAALLLLRGAIPATAQTGPIISEFMAVNTKGLADEDREFSDWIEIYNPANQAVRLDGWHLTDDADDPIKWTFPTGVQVPARGYLVVFASGKDRRIAGATLHTSFRLSGSGEYLALVASSGTTVVHQYAPRFPQQVSDISYGLFPTSTTGAAAYFTQPTPGKANVAGVQGRVAEVEFSQGRGIYTDYVEISLSTATAGAKIYYTMDGSQPSATNGELYTEPIIVGWTAMIRAAAVKAGYLNSRTTTHTYIYTADVAAQSPNGESPGEGWPTSSINGQRFEYGMDPAITHHATWGRQLDQALTAIPSISIVTDLPHLFDPSRGIYVNAGGHGEDWECPASIELIYPSNPLGAGFPDLVQSTDAKGKVQWTLPEDMQPGFQINAGLRIRGGYSRSGGNPKHAFRLFFRGEYGDGELKYRLFGEEGTDQYDCVDLRTSQNYSWAFEHDSSNTLCREVWARDSQGRMGSPYTRSRYYHVYLDGQYWGLYMTEERPEASHGASYLGGDKDDYDVIKVNTLSGYTIEATDGNMATWTQLWQMSIAGFNGASYYRAQGLNPDSTRNPQYPVLLDVDNLIDYMLMILYDGDRDAPISNFLNNTSPNNWYGILNRSEPQGYTFFVHDAEHILSRGMTDRTGPFLCGDQLIRSNPQWIHQQLMVHPDYRIRFADHAYKHLFNNGLLTPDQAIARFRNRANQIDMAIIAESARWGSASLNKTAWQSAINNEIQTFFPSRAQTLIDQLKQTRLLGGSSAPLYPAIDPPSLSRASGSVAKGQTVSMTAAKGSIYYTLDGSDPRLSTGLSSSASVVTLVAENAAKRVLVPTAPIESSPGSILAEYWFGVQGTAVSDLTGNPAFPGSPSATEFLTFFEIGVDRYDNYGTWVRGWLRPAQSGSYTFWIASDDASQLWLSTDETVAKAVMIAQVTGWTGSREWTKNTEQKSKAVSLSAGKKYYIEALQKEGQGGDNLAVAWQGPSIVQQVIPGQFLSPAGIGWITTDFSDTSWRQGTGGVGYERKPSDPVNYTPWIGTDVTGELWGKGPSCYIRIPFTVTNRDLADMVLKARYDDGFIAYLNGTEILRVNFDSQATPAWDSTASASRQDSAAVVAQSFDLTSYVNLLRGGKNVLAIQALNRAASDDDMLLSVELAGRAISQGDVSATGATYSGPIPLGKSLNLKARAFDGRWSAMAEADYTVTNP